MVSLDTQRIKGVMSITSTFFTAGLAHLVTKQMFTDVPEMRMFLSVGLVNMRNNEETLMIKR